MHQAVDLLHMNESLVVARINTNLDKRSHLSCHWWTVGLLPNKDSACSARLVWFSACDLNHNTVTKLMLVQQYCRWSLMCVNYTVVYISTRLRIIEAYSFITT